MEEPRSLSRPWVGEPVEDREPEVAEPVEIRSENPRAASKEAEPVIAAVAVQDAARSKPMSVLEQSQDSPDVADVDSDVDSNSKPKPNARPKPERVGDQKPSQQTLETTSSSTRKRLTMSSPIVDAPAIGPKTASRFLAIGCNTVGDFLKLDAESWSQRLATKWITVNLIEQWQNQARLACAIERLPAAGAGLLVLAELQTVSQIRMLEAEELHQRICQAAQSTEGKRLLRDKPPPPLRVVEGWLASARMTPSKEAANYDETTATDAA